MSSRYIRHSNSPPSLNELETVKADIATVLLKNVRAVHQHCKNDIRTSRFEAGVYLGATGIALMNYYLAPLSVCKGLRDVVEPSQLTSLANTILATSVAILRKDDRIAAIPTPSRASFLETPIGVLTIVLERLVKDSSMMDEVKLVDNWPVYERLLRGVVEEMAREESQPSVNSQFNDGCEVLYGRAGFLYALLRIRAALKYDRGGRDVSAVANIESMLRKLTSDDNLGVVVKSIIAHGKRGAVEYARHLRDIGEHPSLAPDVYPPLMWSWHGKRYMGAAHGVAGILHILWNCPTDVISPFEEDLVGTLRWLVSCQEWDGNWPSKAPRHPDRRGESELVQWCHGATGIVIFLANVLRHVALSKANPKEYRTLSISDDLQRSIIKAADEGARLVYRHGFLRKGVGLCHGIGGSIYALMAVSDVLTDSKTEPERGEAGSGKAEDKGYGYAANKYFRKAVHLAHMAATRQEKLTQEGVMGTPDRPWSLYEGTAGMCCAWAQVLESLKDPGTGTGMPAFDDLPAV